MARVATAPPPPAITASPRSRSGGFSLTKLTVNLTPKATSALVEAAQTNGETKTDAVNRAIEVYAFISRRLADGWELVLRGDPSGRADQRVQFD